MKKVIITGAGGFLGMNLVRRLAQMGIELLAVCHKHVPVEFKEMACEIVTMDLRTSHALDKYLNNETTVFHLAAHANVMASVNDPVFDFETNFLCYFKVLESVRQNGGTLIFSSTASVFDRESDLPVSERSFTRPSSPYGAAKLACESYSFAYHRSFGVDVRVARLFSIYGEGMTRFLIFDLIKQLMDKGVNDIPLNGDGLQIRDYLYKEDAIDGLILIAEKGLAGEDYNLGSGQPTRIAELAHLISKLMDKEGIPIIPQGGSRNAEVPRWYANISKIQTLGFSPKVSLEDGLKKTISWVKNYVCQNAL